MKVINNLADHEEEVSSSGQVDIQHGESAGLHKWKCGLVNLPILIDGVSVKLGPKLFSPREIE